MSTFDSTKASLNDLLREIAEGKIQLPDFQRGWIWDDDHIHDLLVSIARSFPVGAVMLLEAGSEVRLQTRPVEGLENKVPKDQVPEKLILDGQQRLTTLTQALSLNMPVRRVVGQPRSRAGSATAERVRRFRRRPSQAIKPTRREGHGETGRSHIRRHRPADLTGENLERRNHMDKKTAAAAAGDGAAGGSIGAVIGSSTGIAALGTAVAGTWPLLVTGAVIGGLTGAVSLSLGSGGKGTRTPVGIEGESAGRNLDHDSERSRLPPGDNERGGGDLAEQCNIQRPKQMGRDRADHVPRRRVVGSGSLALAPDHGRQTGGSGSRRRRDRAAVVPRRLGCAGCCRGSDEGSPEAISVVRQRRGTWWKSWRRCRPLVTTEVCSAGGGAVSPI